MGAWKILAIVVIAAAVAGVKLGLFAATNPIEARTRADVAVKVATGDPAMQAAYAKGRATLDRFLDANENRPPNSRAFAVKIPVRDGGKVEWFWINEVVRDGDSLRGRINNIPRFVATVRQGDTVRFARNEIVDWMYVQDGRIRGGYTSCALIAKEDPAAREAFMAKFGMECDA